MIYSSSLLLMAKGAYYSSFKKTADKVKKIFTGLLSLWKRKLNPLPFICGCLIKSAVDSTTPQNIEIIVTDNATGEQIGVYHPNSSTGKYLIILPGGKNYNITYNAESYLFHSENLDVRDSTSYSAL